MLALYPLLPATPYRGNFPGRCWLRWLVYYSFGWIFSISHLGMVSNFESSFSSLMHFSLGQDTNFDQESNSPQFPCCDELSWPMGGKFGTFLLFDRARLSRYDVCNWFGCVQSQLRPFLEAACPVRYHAREASWKVDAQLILNTPNWFLRCEAAKRSSWLPPFIQRFSYPVLNRISIPTSFPPSVLYPEQLLIHLSSTDQGVAQ